MKSANASANPVEKAKESDEMEKLVEVSDQMQLVLEEALDHELLHRPWNKNNAGSEAVKKDPPTHHSAKQREHKSSRCKQGANAVVCNLT